jgi:transposase
MSVLSVGIDVAKATITAAVWEVGAGHLLGTYTNDAAGIDVCLAEVARVTRRVGATTVQVGIEPTAGYELPLAGAVVRHGWQVSMVNPVQVRDWAKGQGRRAKTDAQDALVLARYTAEQPVRPWQPLSIPVSELESLLRRQDDLEQLLRQERNRQHFIGRRPGVAAAAVASLDRVIAELEAARTAIKQAIRDHLRHYPELQRDVRLLRTVPGIGERNVLWLLVLLHRWKSRTDGRGLAKGIVAYVGLDPRPFESGSSVRRRATISRMGASHLRRRLFMSAFGGVRGQNPLRQFYDRLVGRGKAKYLALIACARKLLTWAWAVFRTGSAFDPEKARCVVVAP